MSATRSQASGRTAMFSQAGPASPPVTAAGEGRRALFSTPPGPVLHCSACHASSPVCRHDLWSRLPVVPVPFAGVPVLTRCPACRRTTWCRLGFSRAR